MNSARQSLNSESIMAVNDGALCCGVMGVLTDNGLEAVLAVEVQRRLRGQFYGVDNVHAHLDEALYHHLVFL
jgi:hypothetical protein